MNRRKDKTYTAGYSPVLNICNTNHELLDWLTKRFTGSVSFSKTVTGKSRWALTIIKREDIRAMLEATMPYLIVKKERAQLILKFLSLSATRGSEPLVAQASAIAKTIRRLNDDRRPNHCH